MLPSNGLGSGPGEVGQLSSKVKWPKSPLLMTSLTKNPHPQAKNIVSSWA